MKKLTKIVFSAALLFTVSTSAMNSTTAYAAPATEKFFTTPTGYTSAEDVVYVTGTTGTGETIANWGARGEDCVFLSTYAQNFYLGDNVYETLSLVEGGTSQETGHTNALYSALQTLMADAHTFYTYYDGNKNVRDYYKYADCFASDTTQVSLLYRCANVSSTWDSGKTWNQEHVWPQSKLENTPNDKEKIGDLMHLRPANPSENSSRGNKAYGESGSFYNPGPSVRGDCARIVLYMYVRWGMYDQMWGSSGVMENLNILLSWMEEDPVDTWEMARNDSVQSATGTRNVFVDYPEYAWLLFGESIPNDMVTPSGMAKLAPDESETPETPGTPTTPDQPTTPEENPCEKGNHNFGEWIIVNEASETSFGKETRTCPDCGKTEENILPKVTPQTGCQASIALPALASMLPAAVYVFLRKNKED